MQPALMLRACDPIRVAGLLGWNGGCCFRPDSWAVISPSCVEQAVSGQDIVGQREPPQHRVDLIDAAHRELIDAPVSEAGIDAFGPRATLVHALAVRTLHAGPPSGHTRTIVGTRRIRVMLVLAPAGRAVHLHA